MDLNVRREARASADDLARLTQRLGLGLTWWPVATRSLLTCDKNQSFYRFEHPSYFDFFVASRLLCDPTGLDAIQMNAEIKRFLCEGLARQWESNGPLILEPGNLDLNGVGEVFERAVVDLRSEQRRLPAVPETRFYEAIRNPRARTCLHLFESKIADGKPMETVNPRHLGQRDGRTVLIDHATRLIWEQSGSDEELERPMAIRYVAYLNEIQFGGLKGWRLPTIEESASLLQTPVHSEALHVSTLFDPAQWRIWCIDTTEDDVPFRVDFRRGILEQAVEEVVAAPKAGNARNSVESCDSRVTHSTTPFSA